MGEDTTETRLSRRTVMRGTIATAGVGTFAGMLFLAGTESVEGIELVNWEGDDDEIVTEDGSVSAVTVTPTLEIEWDELRDDETAVEVHVEAEVDEARAEIIDEEYTIEGTSGAKTLEFDPINLIEEPSIPVDLFTAPEPGEGNETTVTLNLTVDAPDVDSFEPLEEYTECTYVVGHLPEEQITVDGNAAADIESETEVDDVPDGYNGNDTDDE